MTALSQNISYLKSPSGVRLKYSHH